VADFIITLEQAPSGTALETVSRRRRKAWRVTQRRIGLISDTHGLLRPEVVDALRNADLIVHAGDIGKATILETLRGLAPVKAVRGNVDREAWTSALLKTEGFEIEQVGVYVLHDLGELDLVPEANGIKVVVSGHTHQPAIREKNGVLFVNPGSAGPRRFRCPVSMAFLYIQDASAEAQLVMFGT
jgi:putative phosphoesterase